MAIKGVSDIRRLPRLGKIRLGEKEVSRNTGKEYPKAVDYFVCPPEVQAVYGEKPRVLDIMFPVSDQNVFFPQFYKRYGLSTGLVCKGDGETAMMSQDGEMVEIECVPDECEWYAKKHCRRLANLQFLLPKVPGLGVYQIDTTSFYSIININSSLDMIRAVADRVHMLPLQLVLKPQEVAPDGKKKTVYVLDLVAPFTLAKLLADSQKTPKQLLMPDLDENDRPDDLYPDGVLEKQDPEPLNLDKKAEEKSGEEKQPVQTSGDTKRSDPVKSGVEYPSYFSKADESARDERQPEREPIDDDLEVAWAILGTPLAKQKAILAKPGLDKKALLAQLNSEIDKRANKNLENKNSENKAREKAPAKKQSTPPQAPAPAQAATGSFF